MSISNTTSVGSKLDSTDHLKSDMYKEPPIEDIIFISDQAKELLEEDKKKYLGVNNYSQEELDAMLEQLKDSTDVSSNPLTIHLQCLKIAIRIISGDNIPNKDRAFLAEHEPEMLGRAMLLRRIKENPKDYKSILGGEEVDESTDPTGAVYFRKSESIPVEAIEI